MQRILSALRGLLGRVWKFVLFLTNRFRRLPRYGQAIVIVVVIAILFGLSSLFGSTPPTSTGAVRSVTLRSISELSGNATGASVVGIVRSRSEAELRAEAGGTVRSVNTAIGASVPAGFVLAELENDAERAQVTQAEGAYDAAVAARQGVSSEDVVAAARNSYRDAFETLETTFEIEIGVLFGDPTPVGPDLLINPGTSDPSFLSRERKRLTAVMDSERSRFLTAATGDPQALLSSIEATSREIATFVDALSEAAYATNSNATEVQLAAIARARGNVTGVLSSVTGAQATLRSGASGSTASVDASVKSALGTLRLAQAALEKTRIRAPIGGTVNYLPIRTGDYVSVLDHVATVAQNGALEIVAFVGEDASAGITAGMDIIVEEQYPGTITSVSPALDPVTKQIELHASVGQESGLVNGQSVRLSLPGISAEPVEGTALSVLLPLSAVKLSAGNRVVFTRGEDGRLKAVTVEIGEVVGERIEVTSPLPSDMRIVTDARGLADGQSVEVASP